MSCSRIRQDSLIMRESHFKNLRPTPVAERIHEILAQEMGPIIATAAIRRASDQTGVAVDAMREQDLPVVIPSILRSLKPYSSTELLHEPLQQLLRASGPGEGSGDSR